MAQSTADFQTEALLIPPLKVSPQTLLSEVLEIMNIRLRCATTQSVDPRSQESQLDRHKREAGCALVIDAYDQLVGILTERDVVRLTISNIDLQTTTIAEVMTSPVFSFPEHELTDLFVVYNFMKRHRIRHLPIVNAHDRVQGLVTISSLRRVINQSYFLRFRQVAEIMTPQVVTVLPTDTIRAAAQRLAAYNISCIVVVEANKLNLDTPGIKLDKRIFSKPIGIITERDILQMKVLGLNFDTVKVQDVMSTPLTCVLTTESLGTVQELMYKLKVRRLVVTTAQGELAGIVTETNLTRVLDPLELYGVLEILQLQVSNLTESRDYLLESQHFNLELALKNNEFSLVYQPIINLQTDEIFGAETLIRWFSPPYGQISPTLFIPWAEKTGFIIELGYWILETACFQARQWLNSLQKEMIIAVNISSRQLLDPYFADRVLEILQCTNLSPHLLKLELTESILVEHLRDANDHFRRLQKYGIQIAIDDFGTGYASLSYIQHFSFDILKIDRSFVSNIDQKPKNQAIVTSILKLASQLNFKVVAEGWKP
jgi:EAL domain-containing protein (putative c-di-GMP-specific phosphodiesterase class I)/CBS domain-containing protein